MVGLPAPFNILSLLFPDLMLGMPLSLQLGNNDCSCIPFILTVMFFKFIFIIEQSYGLKEVVVYIDNEILLSHKKNTFEAVLMR